MPRKYLRNERSTLFSRVHTRLVWDQRISIYAQNRSCSTIHPQHLVSPHKYVLCVLQRTVSGISWGSILFDDFALLDLHKILCLVMILLLFTVSRFLEGPDACTHTLAGHGLNRTCVYSQPGESSLDQA